MNKMTPTQKAIAIAALADYQSADPKAGSGYTLMRYARKGFLAPNTDVLSPEQVTEAQALLTKLPYLRDVGPLPEFYPFLRNAQSGHYQLAVTAD